MALESDNFKIILVLLIKEIAFYMQITIVKIGVPEFEKLIKIIINFTS